MASAQKYTIIIPNWHPTPLNKLKGHWSNGYKLKNADFQMVMAYSRGDKGAPKVPYKCIRRRIELVITLAPKQRGCDPDAYWKSLLDALVRAGVLWNDSAAWCEIMPVRYERGSKKSTTIIVTDI